MTLDHLAGLTGISRAYLSQVENQRVDPPRDEKIRRLEKVFDLRPGELIALAHLARTPQDVRDRLAQLHSAFTRAEQTVQTLIGRLSEGAANGQQEGPATGGAFPPAAEGGNVTSPAPVQRQVPIINRVAAGYPAEFTDLDYPAGVADEYLGAPPGLDDPQAFAVRVVGDSMEPKYREGDIVLFGPQAMVRSGDDCYIRFAPESSQGQAATFKRVYFDSETTARLQPLNDHYAPTLVPLTEVAALYRAVYRYESL